MYKNEYLFQLDFEFKNVINYQTKLILKTQFVKMELENLIGYKTNIKRYKYSRCLETYHSHITLRVF